MKIGNRLMSYRLAANLSQQQVADLLGVKQTAITHWENNSREPSFERLEKLAELYNASVSDFFKDDTDKLSETNKNNILESMINELSKLGLIDGNTKFESLPEHIQNIIIGTVNEQIFKIKNL